MPKWKAKGNVIIEADSFEEMNEGEFCLLQALNEPEVFVIGIKEKHWIQNIETFNKRGYEVEDIGRVTLEYLNRYPTAETYNDFGEAKRPRDIYFEPEEELPPLENWLGWKICYRPEADLELIKEVGFNGVFVIPYRLPFCRDYLDRCKNLGLKVFFPTREVDTVNEWKDHPAIHAWMTWDEPEAYKITKEQQKATYDAIKAVDSRPIGVCYQFNSTTEAYFEPRAFDFCLGAFYPFNYKTYTYWEKALKDMIGYVKALRPDKPFLPVIQASYTQCEDTDPGTGFLRKPNGHIAEMFNLYRREGGKPNGIAFWVWTFGDEYGMREKVEIRNEVKEVLKNLP